MKKMLLVIVTVIGFGIMANAQDIILKKQNFKNCVKKTAVGLDIGIGGGEGSEVFSSALGIRATHHFNSYFGIDFVKVNWITDVAVYDGLWTMKLQLMLGVRGNSPTFFKCMSAYAAFRLGYGMHVTTGYYGTVLKEITDFKGLCLETELGLNLTPAIFVGFSYNYHKGFGDYFSNSPWQHTLSTRFGFNFGKKNDGGRVSNRQISTHKPNNNEFGTVYKKPEKVKVPLDKIATGKQLLGYGIGLSAVGVFLMVPGFVTGDYGLPVVIAGYVFTGVGGGLTIAGIPILSVGLKERAKKKDFAIENFGVFDVYYQPTLNLAYIGNGIGVSLKF